MKPFKLLDRGLWFYPIGDRGKTFEVADTYTIELRREDFEKFAEGKWDIFPFNITKNTIRFNKYQFYSLIHYMEEVLYKKICQEIPKGELDKADWVKPCSPSIMNFEGETIMTFFVDLLREVK